MDKQIEEIRNDLSNAWHSDIIIGDKFKDVAEKLTRLGYRKIPEGAVVLTPAERDEEMRLIREDVIERMEATRKETAEKFAKRFKAHLKQSYHNLYHSEYREGMVSINLDTLIENIDEICKELVDE